MLQRLFVSHHPEEAARTLHQLLELHTLFASRDLIDQKVPDSGLALLIQHGLYDPTGPGGGRLTRLGSRVLDALRRESANNYQELATRSEGSARDFEAGYMVSPSGLGGYRGAASAAVLIA